MDFKFSKDSGNSQQEVAPGGKKNQNSLLVLLLILVGGFTYLYFFTGLIKPQQAVTPAVPTTAAPQVVKMPLPSREGEPAKAEGKKQENLEALTTAPTAPVTAAVPAVKPSAVPAKPPAPPAAKAVPPPTAKPITVAAQPAGTKPQKETTAVKNGGNVSATKAEVKKPVIETKKTAVADKKHITAQVIKKPVLEDHTKPKAITKSKKAAPESWSLMVGNYVLEETLSADMGRVRKAGFEPIVKPSTRKKTSMNRLFVSDFNNRAAAQSALQNLKQHTSDAFIIEQGGRFSLYAGSYLQTESAHSEKERLKTAGFSTTVKHSDIAIPTQSLSIGPFNSKKMAEAALAKLKIAGFKATLLQK